MSKGPEYQRQKRLTDALTLFGWRWVHSRPAITAKGWRTALEGSPGFVDILAVHPERRVLLFVEVKAEKGRRTPDQALWGKALSQVGVRQSASAYWLADSDASEAALLAVISDGRA